MTSTNNRSKIKSIENALSSNENYFINNTLLVTSIKQSLHNEQLKFEQYGQKHYKLYNMNSELPPDICELAAKAYYQLRRLSQDQLIVVINNKFGKANLMKEIFYLSRNIKKQEKLYQMHVILEEIVEIFQNYNLLYEFYFNARGRLVGFKASLLTFLTTYTEKIHIDLNSLEEKLKLLGIRSSKRNTIKEYISKYCSDDTTPVIYNLLLNYILHAVNSKTCNLINESYENVIRVVSSLNEFHDEENVEINSILTNLAYNFYSNITKRNNNQVGLTMSLESDLGKTVQKKVKREIKGKDLPNEIIDNYDRDSSGIEYMGKVLNDFISSNYKQFWFIYGVEFDKNSRSLNSEDRSIISKFIDFELIFDISFTLSNFCERYNMDPNFIESFFYNRNIDNSYYYIDSSNYIHINSQIWKLFLEDELRLNTKVNKANSNIYENESFYSTNMNNIQNINSMYDKSIVSPVKSNEFELENINPEKISYHKSENVETKSTLTRRIWVFVVHITTLLLPNFVISLVFRKKSKDVQMAFREKLTIFTLIILSWIIILFTNIVLGLLLCKNRENFYKPEELTGLQNYDLGVYMYGNIYNISRFARSSHGKGSKISPRGVEFSDMEQFGGKDVTFMFPLNLNIACPNLDNIDDKTELKYNTTDNDFNPVFIHSSFNQYKDIDDPNWFKDVGSKKLKNMQIGKVVYDKKDLKKQRDDSQKPIAYINNRVYDLSPYFYTKDQPGVSNFGFLPQPVEEAFKDSGFGPDLTSVYNQKLKRLSNIKSVMNCLDSVFFVGELDPRLELQCQLTNYLLIAFTAIAILVTLIKFLAALQLSGKKEPIENPKKFVIFQVPCYTENEESIKRTIDSLALLEYEDKQKLLFLIADGMVTGSGNEKSTPEIILDLLGCNSDIQKSSEYSYKSVNEGYHQLNYGKIYSGIYEIEDKQVPFIVVIKIGNSRETTKNGNRGKRDSQIILLNFLKNLYYNEPMCPLELEIYNHINNKLGIDPNLYEYILMVDADTMVEPDSLTNLVSIMIRDQRIIGLCGETQIYDQNRSVVTMGQVYEYYISHNLAKSFESLFGSVTCLPGCFSMYRIKSPNNSKPLIIHKNILKDYSENKVDTLHKKNLLHLGEDRYLTTLIIKYFPMYKTKFTPYAICKTVVPEKFTILLSQRRRWINSTIHNFFELILLKDMCGFCLFSMRFIVFLDLIGTLLLPASVIYLVYIIIAAITKVQIISNESIIMICSIYIIQALVFVIKRKWEHIGWMFIYLFGIFFFNFYIPIYSFWHFDDFSWGNTRKINGDSKQNTADEKGYVDDSQYENTFDVKKVPLIKLSDYYCDVSSPNEYLSGFDNKSMYSNPVNSRSMYYDNNQINPGQLISHQSSYINQYNPRPASIVHMDSNSIIQQNSNFVQNYNSPTDDEIIYEIKSILPNVDLMQVTKKQIRNMLSERFQTDLEYKRDFINQCIELILSNQL